MGEKNIVRMLLAFDEQYPVAWKYGRVTHLSPPDLRDAAVRLSEEFDGEVVLVLATFDFTDRVMVVQRMLLDEHKQSLFFDPEALVVTTEKILSRPKNNWLLNRLPSIVTAYASRTYTVDSETWYLMEMLHSLIQKGELQWA